MSDTSEPTPPEPAEPVRAPEFDGAREWFNVPGPLSLRALRGKIVLLDFWTYGCINCIHVIPDLKALEAAFPDELVVIGIHSGKYTNEKDAENLRRVLVRYEIEHPVANDADFRIWKAYTVRAWPTRVIIDPAGYIVGSASGEGNLDGFKRAIGGVARVFEARGELDRAPLPLALERARTADLPLAFPGKVLADAGNDRLFISDTNHHRIVVARTDGAVVQVIGSGLPGDADGIFTQARFCRPQGLAVDGDTLYVADTGNHRIREVQLTGGVVTTIAGTGRQASPGAEGGDALDADLSSPWDLALRPGILLIAMAGPHQIWVMDLLNAQVYPYAGSGREAREDGDVSTAAFAQPSGLALDGDALYVADAESNIIRRVALPPVNQVATIAGGDLFEFGDVDAIGDAARFQHPLGVTVHEGGVFIADTYNHKVRRLDPRTREVITVASGFAEPGGLSAGGGTLYVADTNHHTIRTVDLRTHHVSTLPLRGLVPPRWTYLAEGAARPTIVPRQERSVGQVRLRAGEGAIVLDVQLRAGLRMNPHAAQLVTFVQDGALLGTADLEAQQDMWFPARFPFAAMPGRMRLEVLLDAYVCDDSRHGLCRLAAVRWTVEVEVTEDDGSGTEVVLPASI